MCDDRHTVRMTLKWLSRTDRSNLGDNRRIAGLQLTGHVEVKIISFRSVKETISLHLFSGVTEGDEWQPKRITTLDKLFNSSDGLSCASDGWSVRFKITFPVGIQRMEYFPATSA